MVRKKGGTERFHETAKNIRLSLSHIDAGLTSEYPHDPENCPIAFALKEAIPEALELEVAGQGFLANRARSIIRIRLEDGKEFVGRIDRHAANWLSHWDQQVKLLLAHRRHSFEKLRKFRPVVQLEWYREPPVGSDVWELM